MRFDAKFGAFAMLVGLSVGASALTPAVASAGGNVTVARGVVLHVIESGRANSKPPLAFIPGWSASAEIWEGQITRFDHSYRVIAFDPRSQGESTKTTSGNTPEQRAADLHALLAAKKIIRPVLVGWSQAAQDIAAYVSLYGTGDLAGIVLVDAAVSEGAEAIPKHPEQAAARFARFALYTSEQEAFVRRMVAGNISKPQPAGLVEAAVAAAMKTPPSIGIAQLVADLYANDRTPALAKIDCPVLLIASSKSDELPAQRSEAQQIRNARLVEIADAAHAVFLDQPDQFEAALSSFLAEIAPGPAGQ